MAIERRIREPRLVLASGSKELKPAESPGVSGHWKFNLETGNYDFVGEQTAVQSTELPTPTVSKVVTDTKTIVPY